MISRHKFVIIMLHTYNMQGSAEMSSCQYNSNALVSLWYIIQRKVVEIDRVVVKTNQYCPV